MELPTEQWKITHWAPSTLWAEEDTVKVIRYALKGKIKKIWTGNQEKSDLAVSNVKYFTEAKLL